MKTNTHGLFRGLLVMSVLFLLQAGPAGAQWVTQDQVLTSGWNAVYLTIAPEPAGCDFWFSVTNVEQVSTYNDVFSPIQFAVDPAAQTVPGPDWLRWYPLNSTNSAMTSLHTLRAGRAYLVKLTSGTATIRFKGRPVLSPRTWRDDRFNLTGFLIDGPNAPTFSQFFAPSPAHAGQRIYRMVSGVWTQSPSNAPMRSGEAFWVYCKGSSDYQGPLEVTTDTRAGLDYGSTLSELPVAVRNVSGSNRTVSVKLLTSEAPPASADQPQRAGEVPLSWWDSQVGVLGAWREFPSNGFTRIDASVATGQEQALRFAVRRRDFTPFAPPPGDVGHYGSVLEVTDGRGTRALVPVTAEGTVLPGETGIVRRSNAGLWVGDVIIDRVNQAVANNTQQAHSPSNAVAVGAGAEFAFRAIWHLDTNGVARLLPEVNIMWRNGTYTNTAGGLATVGQPGRYVLVTGDRPTLVSELRAATDAGGSAGGRRISSTAVAGRSPIVMARGSFAATNTYSCPLSLAYDNPMNPFQHRYHPSHDNLDYDGTYLISQPNSAGDPDTRESYTITRHVAMRFEPLDTDGGVWNDTVLGGTWTETITGLRKENIVSAGQFLLHKVSDVAVLNDGL